MSVLGADSYAISLYLSNVYDAKVSVSKAAALGEKMAGCTWLEATCATEIQLARKFDSSECMANGTATAWPWGGSYLDIVGVPVGAAHALYADSRAHLTRRPIRWHLASSGAQISATEQMWP